MHRAEFGSAVSAIMTMPHFALILEITPLKSKTMDVEKWSHLQTGFWVPFLDRVDGDLGKT